MCGSMPGAAPGRVSTSSKPRPKGGRAGRPGGGSGPADSMGVWSGATPVAPRPAPGSMPPVKRLLPFALALSPAPTRPGSPAAAPRRRRDPGAPHGAGGGPHPPRRGRAARRSGGGHLARLDHRRPARRGRTDGGPGLIADEGRSPRSTRCLRSPTRPRPGAASVPRLSPGERLAAAVTPPAGRPTSPSPSRAHRGAAGRGVDLAPSRPRPPCGPGRRARPAAARSAKAADASADALSDAARRLGLGDPLSIAAELRRASPEDLAALASATLDATGPAYCGRWTPSPAERWALPSPPPTSRPARILRASHEPKTHPASRLRRRPDRSGRRRRRPRRPGEARRPGRPRQEPAAAHRSNPGAGRRPPLGDAVGGLVRVAGLPPRAGRGPLPLRHPRGRRRGAQARLARRCRDLELPARALAADRPG